jgi:uncharacterized protein YkwD
MSKSLLLVALLLGWSSPVLAQPFDDVDSVDDMGEAEDAYGPVVPAVQTPVRAARPARVMTPVSRVWFQEMRCLTVYGNGSAKTTCQVIRSGSRSTGAVRAPKVALAPVPRVVPNPLQNVTPVTPVAPVAPNPLQNVTPVAPVAPVAPAEPPVEVPPPAPATTEPAPATVPAPVRVPAARMPAAPTSAAPAEPDAVEQAVAMLLNAARRSVGLGDVTLDSALSRVARAHSQDMCSRKYFAHQTPEKKAPWDRIKAAGIAFQGAAENIAAGQKTVYAVHQTWMTSAGHFANRMNADYTKIGVGRVDCAGVPYWTEVFTK